VTDPPEVSAFGKELPKQSVGVFIGAALPGMMRQGKVEQKKKAEGVKGIVVGCQAKMRPSDP
jgi:hypothetical protein